MRKARVLHHPIWLVLTAALYTAGMWLYVQRVLVPHQIADAAATGRPRGNLSDLYPRWVGARELLLHGRDPYSPEVTREIQAGYYGRPLDPDRPEDPKDQQGFAYPVYVVFLLAPTLSFPFAVVQRVFWWVLLALTAASIPLWLRVLRWTLPVWAKAALIILTLGSFAVVQGLKLQQISLLVAALIPIAIALLVTDHPIPAGILLALATIKPQLVWLLLLWLGLWTLGDWRRRHRWALSFLTTMAIFFLAAEIWLPHWIARFWQAVHAYRSYSDAVPLLDKLIPPPWSRLPELAVLIAAAYVGWRHRRFAADTEAFASGVGLMLASTLLLVPTYAPYNQVLLIPAVLLLAREREAIWQRTVARFLWIVVAILLGWPWLAAAALAVLSFLWPAYAVEKLWVLPAWTVLTFPVGVVALMLLRSFQKPFIGPADPSTS